MKCIVFAWQAYAMIDILVPCAVQISRPAFCRNGSTSDLVGNRTIADFSLRRFHGSLDQKNIPAFPPRPADP